MDIRLTRDGKIAVDLSCEQQSSLGLILCDLYYNLRRNSLLSLAPNRYGYPHNGGEHTFHITGSLDDVKTYLELLAEEYSPGKTDRYVFGWKALSRIISLLDENIEEKLSTREGRAGVLKTMPNLWFEFLYHTHIEQQVRKLGFHLKELEFHTNRPKEYSIHYQCQYGDHNGTIDIPSFGVLDIMYLGEGNFLVKPFGLIMKRKDIPAFVEQRLKESFSSCEPVVMGCKYGHQIYDKFVIRRSDKGESA